MLKTVEGILREGRIELIERPGEADGSRVLATLLPKSGSINLPRLGIRKEEAANLRWRLGAIVEDWDHPDMDVYSGGPE